MVPVPATRAGREDQEFSGRGLAAGPRSVREHGLSGAAGRLARICHDGHVRRFVVVSSSASATANQDLPFDPEKSRLLGPGRFLAAASSAILHLIYSRFFTRVFRDLGMTQARRSRAC
jgi:hypothetical protein